MANADGLTWNKIQEIINKNPGDPLFEENRKYLAALDEYRENLRVKDAECARMQVVFDSIDFKDENVAIEGRFVGPAYSTSALFHDASVQSGKYLARAFAAAMRGSYVNPKVFIKTNEVELRLSFTNRATNSIIKLEPQRAEQLEIGQSAVFVPNFRLLDSKGNAFKSPRISGSTEDVLPGRSAWVTFYLPGNALAEMHGLRLHLMPAFLGHSVEIPLGSGRPVEHDPNAKNADGQK